MSLAAGVRRPEIASGEKAEGPGGGERRASATSPASACSTINRSAKRTASPPPAAVTRSPSIRARIASRVRSGANNANNLSTETLPAAVGASRKPALLLLFSRGESQPLFPASLCLHPWEPRHGPLGRFLFDEHPARRTKRKRRRSPTSPIVRCGKRSYNLSGDPTTTVLRGEVVCAGRCDGFMCSGSEICKGGETRGTRDQRSDGHSEDRK